MTTKQIMDHCKNNCVTKSGCRDCKYQAMLDAIVDDNDNDNNNEYQQHALMAEQEFSNY